jgi:hypothetical protein
MLKVLEPKIITTALLISHGIAEPDTTISEPAVWSATAGYAIDARVTRTDTHYIYQCVATVSAVVSPAANTAPELATDVWVQVKPTNRWAMFDQSVNTDTLKIGTHSGAATSLAFEINPGRCNGLALLGLSEVKTIKVLCKRAGSFGISSVVETVPSLGVTRKSYTLTGFAYEEFDINVIKRTVSDWSGFFREPYDIKTDVMLSFPSAVWSSMTITLTGYINESDIAVSSVIPGNYVEMGDVSYGVNSSIEDYSVKEFNEFGVATLVERDYAKRVSFSITTPDWNMRRVFSTLAALRAKPAVFIGSDSYLHTPFTVYGYCENFSLSLDLPTISYINLEVKGLT